MSKVYSSKWIDSNQIPSLSQGISSNNMGKPSKTKLNKSITNRTPLSNKNSTTCCNIQTCLHCNTGFLTPFLNPKNSSNCSISNYTAVNSKAIYSNGLNHASNISASSSIDFSHESSRSATKLLLLNFCRWIKPLVFVMNVCGVFSNTHFDQEVKAAFTIKLFPFKFIQKFCGQTAYCIALNLLVWFNFFRYLFACFLASVTTGNASQIVNTIWMFQCASIASVMLRSSYSKHMLPSFFNSWLTFSEYREFHYEESVWRMSYKLFINVSQRVRGGIRLYLIWTLYTVIQNLLDLCGDSAYSDALTAPFKNVPNYGVYFFLGVNMLGTAVMNLPLILFVAVCMLLSAHFSSVAEILQQKICIRDGLGARDLEMIRTHHQYIANMVQKADEIFSSLLLLTFTANLPLSCLSIYNLTKAQHLLEIYSLSAWLVIGLLNVALVSWFAGSVVERAHSPLKHIYNIRVPRGASEAFVLQVNLFLSRLDGSHIAFTLFNLASVTKSFAVTMGGLCLTYTAIAIQMTPLFEASKSNSTCIKIPQ